MHKVFLAVSLFFMSLETVRAQSPDPAWLDELRLQLLIEKVCQSAYFLNLYESEGPLGLHQQARVQCQDGRMFDAERFSPDESFTLQACGTQVCSDHDLSPPFEKS